MNDLIEFKNVSYSYDEDDKTYPVLNELSLCFEKGSFTAVLGHNGSGKSTLAKLMNGLILPTAGDVIVYDMNTKNESDSLLIKKSVGLVFQNPDNQLVASSVEDDVAFGLENTGVPHSEMPLKIESALKAVDMLEYRNFSPNKLSGGQKQRVAIAGVVAMEPKCIVFDEPTAMLDPKGRREVLDTILSLTKDKNITVVLITHFMDEAALADRVIVLDDGVLKLDGTPKSVFNKISELQAMGLDVPVAAQLINSLNEHGNDIVRDAVSVDECVDALTDALRRK